MEEMNDGVKVLHPTQNSCFRGVLCIEETQENQ